MKATVKVSEKQIQSAILDYLKAVGIFAWRVNSGAMALGDGGNRRFVRFGLVGMSDIIGILPDGRMLAIEVKAAGGKTTVYQDDFLQRVQENNGVAFVARSVEDVELKLKKGIKCLT